jgi:hypothetical protein
MFFNVDSLLLHIMHDAENCFAAQLSSDNDGNHVDYKDLWSTNEWTSRWLAAVARPLM